MATQQPPWTAPEAPPPLERERMPDLRMYNSLTRTKNQFWPRKGNKVDWYACGPTVYDDSVSPPSSSSATSGTRTFAIPSTPIAVQCARL